MVPLFTSDEKRLGEISLDDLHSIRQRCRIIRNRRNNITRAYLKDLSGHDLAKFGNRRGMHFEQQLNSGHVHALHGIRGSY